MSALVSDLPIIYQNVFPLFADKLRAICKLFFFEFWHRSRH